MLAPVAHIPEPMAGICQLHLDVGGADDPDIYLAARTGNLLALAGRPFGATGGRRPCNPGNVV